MSGHADPIAYSLAEARALHELGVRNHGWYVTESEHRGVLAALDALVAENQQLRDALEEIDHYSHMGDGAWDAYLHVKQIAARAILAGTPSEDTE